MSNISRIEYGGTIYEGEIDGSNGKGTITYNDGSKYEGEWKQLQPNGYGVVYNADGGKKFEGNFVDGRLDGQGTMYYPDYYYVGDIVISDNNTYIPEGQGTIYRYDGKKWREGQFVNGVTHGHTKLYDEKGNFYFEGEIYYDENGKLLNKSHGIQYSNGRHKIRAVNGEWVEVGQGSGRSSGGSSSGGSSSGSSSDDGCGCSSCLGSIVAILIIWWLLGWMGFVAKPSIKFLKKDKTEQVEQVEEKQEAPAKKKTGNKRKKARQATPAEEQPAAEETKGGFHLEPVEEEPAQESSGKSFHLEPVEEVPSGSPSTPEETPAE